MLDSPLCSRCGQAFKHGIGHCIRSAGSVLYGTCVCAPCLRRDKFLRISTARTIFDHDHHRYDTARELWGLSRIFCRFDDYEGILITRPTTTMTQVYVIAAYVMRCRVEDEVQKIDIIDDVKPLIMSFIFSVPVAKRRALEIHRAPSVKIQ